MRTLKIEHGDLVVAPGGFAMVSGPDRVKQDLAVAVREPLGSDRFHPRWGSTLADFVGGIVDETTKALVISEVHRIIRNYVAVHGDQIRADRLAGRRPRYSTGDLVDDVADVQVRQEADRLYVRVKITCVSGEQVTLTQAMGV